MRAAITHISNWKRTVFFVSLFWLISVFASAQQLTFTDSICVNSLDVHYGIQAATSTSIFTWGFSSGYPVLGTIDTTATAVDSVITIDWGSTSGLTRIYAIEQTADGCFGDTVYLDVYLDELPTVLISGSNVCPTDSSSVVFDLTGQAPWNIEINDGTNTFNYVTSTTPFTVFVDRYAAGSNPTINVVSVSDANGCNADLGAGVNTTLTIYPTPVSGGIYHY